MRISVVFFLYIAVMFVWVPVALAEEDSIYGQCIDQTDDPPPWCYQMTVERVGDPALCENILKYWPRADGVHGACPPLSPTSIKRHRALLLVAMALTGSAATA